MSTLSYIKNNISSCNECPIEQDHDYFATCDISNKNVICKCKIPFIFNDDQTKCIHVFQDDIPIYFIHYMILIPAHFYLLMSALRLYIYKVKKYYERKKPKHLCEKLLILINGNAVISGILLGILFLLCKGIRELLFVWVKPRSYEILSASFYFLCATGTLLFYKFSILTRGRIKKKLLIRKVLCNLSLCFCFIGYMVLVVGTFVKDWPSILTDIFNTYMMGVYALLLIVGIIYFGKKITLQVATYKRSSTIRHMRTSSFTGLKERKKIQILIVMKHYLKFLGLYLVFNISLVIFDSRSLYNDEWHPYSKQKQLIFIIIWRISDYILFISVFRIFEGTTHSRIFPWLHFCNKYVDEGDHRRQIVGMNTIIDTEVEITSFRNKKLPNEVINPMVKNLRLFEVGEGEQASSYIS